MKKIILSLVLLLVSSPCFAQAQRLTKADNMTVDGVKLETIVDSSSFIDMKTKGVLGTSSDTTWQDLMPAIISEAESSGKIITCSGCTLKATKTLDLGRANVNLTNAKIQAGTANGSDFFTATQTNRAVTFTTGTPVVVNLASHGLLANEEFQFGVSFGGKLPSSLKFLTTYYVKEVLSDGTFSISETAGGSAVNATVDGTGTFYLFQGGTQSGIETTDILEYSGKIKRLGIAVKTGANGDNIAYLSQRVIVNGDGSSDFSSHAPTVAAISHVSDDSPNADYNLVANSSYVGVVLGGGAEKHKIAIHGAYNRHLVYVPKDASADTLRVDIYGANCQAWVTEAEAVETSIKYVLSVENRSDPSIDSTSDSPDSPAIFIRNGKASTLAGKFRAMSGKTAVLASAMSNSTGSNVRSFANRLNFDDFELVHGYGMAVDLDAIRYVEGLVTVVDWDNSNGYEQEPNSAFHVGRVSNMSGLVVVGNAIRNIRGLDVGGGTSYSLNANLGKWSIDMGSLSQFTTFSNPIAEQTGADGNPTTLTAWNFRKCKTCFIDLLGTRGRGNIESLATDSNNILVTPNSTLYTVAKNDAASANTIINTTASSTGLTIIPVEYNMNWNYLAPDITFSRGSTGYSRVVDGYFTSISTNLPRFQFSKDIEAVGLVYEAASTNLSTYSGFTADQTLSRLTQSTATGILTPYGDQTGVKWNEVAQSATTFYQSRTTNDLAYTSGEIYTKSIITACGGTDTNMDSGIQIMFPLTYFSSGFAGFDISVAPATVGYSTNVDATHSEDLGEIKNADGSVDAYGRHWCRIGITRVAASSGTSSPGNIAMTGDNPTSTSRRPNYNGDINRYVIVATDQVEQSTKPTSLMRTNGSSFTRAADDLSFTIPTGVDKLKYTFDDDTTQNVTGLSSGAYTVPTNLNRSIIKKIESY